jgi:hypothetical protein
MDRLARKLSARPGDQAARNRLERLAVRAFGIEDWERYLFSHAGEDGQVIAAVGIR